MFRTLIIVAALVLVYLLLKNRLQNRKKNYEPKKPSEDTVQCLECKTYVPGNEAIASDNQHFCCKQHQRDWQTRQN